MIYFVVALLLIFLSYYYDIERNTKGKKTWYVVVLILLVLIAGMRYRLGTDTIMYINHFYNGKIPQIKDINFRDIGIGNNPLWILLNSVILTTFGKFYIVQFIQSIFINLLLLIYIKKHSKHVFTCIFIYFIWMYTCINMEELKASFSIILSFYANDYVLDKKWIKAYSLFFIAILFHPSSIIPFFMPLLLSLRFNKQGICILIISFLVGIIIPSTITDYLFLFEGDEVIYRKAEEYFTASHFIGQEKSFVYLLVHNYIILAYSLFAVYYINRFVNDSELKKFEPYILFAILFLILQINVQIMYRFVHFYFIYVVFYISRVFVYISRKSIIYDTSEIFKAFLFILPLIVCISYTYKRKYYRYYPYSSIIERKIDSKREQARAIQHPWEPVAKRTQY